MMGEALAQTLTGKPRNTNRDIGSIPQILDIEYQTYGWVLQNNWNMKFNFIGNIKTVKKQFESRSIKKVDSFRINTLEYACVMSFDKVLTEETVDYVIQHLAEANFDPELFTIITKKLNNSLQPNSLDKK
jgi:hypothetical protein